MKRLLILIAMSVTLVGMTPAKHRPRPDVSFGIFYSSLSPYGEWIDCNLGYVWRPFHVSHGWRPYLAGRWVWTSYGWYWSSYEPFGWATFHYGRWYYDDYYGWIWTPDETWGPAWVEWRYNDDYIGWAPLPPNAFYDVNVGIRFSNNWIAPHHYWNFVPYHRFTAERVVEYVQPVNRNPRIFGNTRGVVNIRTTDDRVINPGVDVRMIERRGNVRINTVDVVERSRSDGDKLLRDGNHERLEIYRPRLDGGTREDIRRPAEVRRADKPIMLDGERGSRTDRREPVQPIPRDRRENFTPPDRQRDSNPRDGWKQDATPPPERRFEKPRPRDGREVQRRDEGREMRKPEIGRFQREPQRTPVQPELERRSPNPRKNNDHPGIDRREGKGREQDRGHGESRTRERRPR